MELLKIIDKSNGYVFRGIEGNINEFNKLAAAPTNWDYDRYPFLVFLDTNTFIVSIPFLSQTFCVSVVYAIANAENKTLSALTLVCLPQRWLFKRSTLRMMTMTTSTLHSQQARTEDGSDSVVNLNQRNSSTIGCEPVVDSLGYRMQAYWLFHELHF